MDGKYYEGEDTLRSDELPEEPLELVHPPDDRPPDDMGCADSPGEFVFGYMFLGVLAVAAAELVHIGLQWRDFSPRGAFAVNVVVLALLGFDWWPCLRSFWVGKNPVDSLEADPPSTFLLVFLAVSGLRFPSVAALMFLVGVWLLLGLGRHVVDCRVVYLAIPWQLTVSERRRLRSGWARRPREPEPEEYAFACVALSAALALGFILPEVAFLFFGVPYLVACPLAIPHSLAFAFVSIVFMGLDRRITAAATRWFAHSRYGGFPWQFRPDLGLLPVDDRRRWLARAVFMTTAGLVSLSWLDTDATLFEWRACLYGVVTGAVCSSVTIASALAVTVGSHLLKLEPPSFEE